MSTSVWVYTSVQMGKSKQCVFRYNKSSENIGALFANAAILFLEIFNVFENKALFVLYSIYFLTLTLCSLYQLKHIASL